MFTLNLKEYCSTYYSKLVSISYWVQNKHNYINFVSVVFCIHGNKFGVANCCEDLWPISGSGHAAADLNHVVDDKAPLVTSDDDEGHQHERQSSQDPGKCIHHPLSKSKIHRVIIQIVQGTQNPDSSEYRLSSI